jgi:hypothetical protein
LTGCERGKLITQVFNLAAGRERFEVIVGVALKSKAAALEMVADAEDPLSYKKNIIFVNVFSRIK